MSENSLRSIRDVSEFRIGRSPNLPGAAFRDLNTVCDGRCHLGKTGAGCDYGGGAQRKSSAGVLANRGGELDLLAISLASHLA